MLKLIRNRKNELELLSNIRYLIFFLVFIFGFFYHLSWVGDSVYFLLQTPILIPGRSVEPRRLSSGSLNPDEIETQVIQETENIYSNQMGENSETEDEEGEESGSNSSSSESSRLLDSTDDEADGKTKKRKRHTSSSVDRKDSKRRKGLIEIEDM